MHKRCFSLHLQSLCKPTFRYKFMKITTCFYKKQRKGSIQSIQYKCSQDKKKSSEKILITKKFWPSCGSGINPERSEGNGVTGSRTK